MYLEELQIRGKCSPLPPSASAHLEKPDASVFFQCQITGPTPVAQEGGSFLHLVPGGRRLAELPAAEGAVHGPAGRPGVPGLVTPGAAWAPRPAPTLACPPGLARWTSSPGHSWQFDRWSELWQNVLEASCSHLTTLPVLETALPCSQMTQDISCMGLGAGQPPSPKKHPLPHSRPSPHPSC